MAALLTSEEENAAEVFLIEIQSVLQNEAVQPSKDEAIRFLMARKFDIKRSIDLFISHKLMREREQIDLNASHIDSIKKELSSDKFTILEGRDKDGSAIALFRARFHQPLITSHCDTLRALILQLDTALESMQTQRNGLVFIFDMTSSHFNNFDYDLSTKILNMLKGGYPSRLKKVLIVTAPLWFKAPFKFLRMFVREKLRERVFTIERKSLLVHIPISTLPVYLGGDAAPFHKKWIGVCLKRLNTSMDISAYLEGTSVCDSPLSSAVSSICDHDAAPDSPMISNGGARKRNHDMAPSPSDTPSSRRRGSNPLRSIHQPCEANGMTVIDLVRYCRVKSKIGLISEYNQIKICEENHEFIASKHNDNLIKNRYLDVLCLDTSRVVLPPRPAGSEHMGDHNDQPSDYINANLLDGYKQTNAYISTQGPLPNTFGDFWHMLWDQMVLLIIMTTKVSERGRTKCGQYWPISEGTAVQYAYFTIATTAVNTSEDYTITCISLLNRITKETRVIKHLQFTSWPDYGVPVTASGLLNFLKLARRTQKEAWLERYTDLSDRIEPPIVVHCSAGIGRTGTFMTIDITTKCLMDTQKCDVQTTVKRIRSQRAHSIQMPEQYCFCYTAVIEFATENGLITNGDADLTGFDDQPSSDDSDFE